MEQPSFGTGPTVEKGLLIYIGLLDAVCWGGIPSSCEDRVERALWDGHASLQERGWTCQVEGECYV